MLVFHVKITGNETSFTHKPLHIEANKNLTSNDQKFARRLTLLIDNDFMIQTQIDSELSLIIPLNGIKDLNYFNHYVSITMSSENSQK